MKTTTATTGVDLSGWLEAEGGASLLEHMEERRAGVLARLGEEGIAPFAGAVDVDALVGSLALPADGWISLVKGHSSSLPRSFQTADGLVDLGQVTRAYAEGSTVLLTKLQRRVPRVGRFCRALEEALLAAGLVPSQRVGANLYLTPQGSQGFDLHWDDHEVLVIQLDGAKHWEIYREAVPFPAAPPSRPLELDEVGAPILEHVLTAGDVLYVPSGFPHQAHADARVGSSHITLSLHLATWVDVLSRVLKDHPGARRPVGLGAREGDPADAGLRPVLDDLDDLGKGERLTSSVDTLRDRFVEGLDLLPDGGLGARHPYDGLDGGTEVVVRRGIVARLVEDGDDAVVLTVPGAAIRCSANARPALEHLLEHRRCRVETLPGMGPEDQAHFVSALISYGMLRRAEET